MHYTSKTEIRTKGFTDVVDITGAVLDAVNESGVAHGTVTVFIPGSTASVTTIEYEEGVVEDLREAVEAIVPSTGTYRHDERWGDGNGFSHVRAALMKPGLTIPVVDGEPTLGTWQQVVVMDFDNRPRDRAVVIQVTGDRDE